MYSRSAQLALSEGGGEQRPCMGALGVIFLQESLCKYLPFGAIWSVPKANNLFLRGMFMSPGEEPSLTKVI